MVRNDHRVETDGDAEIRQDKEPDRARERQHLGPTAERAPGDERDSGGCDRPPGQYEDVRPPEPARGDSRVCDRGPDAPAAHGREHGPQTDPALPAGGAPRVSLRVPSPAPPP